VELKFQEAMAANFGMQEHLDDEGNPYDYSSLFQQYDPLGQEALGDTYSSAIGKAEGKSRNTLEEAFRLARSGKQGFGGIGSSLQEAFNRSFNTRREAGDLAMQQYQSGAFDLQSDFTGEFEDLLAQISGYGVGFDSSLIDEDWTMGDPNPTGDNGNNGDDGGTGGTGGGDDPSDPEDCGEGMTWDYNNNECATITKPIGGKGPWDDPYGKYDPYGGV
jgi:hypothetical protein